MSEDYVNPKERERVVRNRGARRDKWLSRKWRRSTKGNDFLNVDGVNVVVFRGGGGWIGRIAKPLGFDPKTLKSVEHTETTASCSTSDAAKLAAFDLLEARGFLRKDRR